MSSGGAPNLLFRLVVAGQVAGELLGQAIEASGLTATEYTVLSIITAYRPLGPTELAERGGMPPATVSDHLVRLERRGLVERSPNPDDRRSSLLEPTAEGLRCNEVALSGLQAANRVLAARLGTDAEMVRAALAELESALREVVDPGSNERTSAPK